MNGTALGLVLTAAFLHAAWNFAAKRVRSGGTTFVWAYYTVGSLALLPGLVIALATGHAQFEWTWLVAGLVTAVLHIGYALVLQRGYDVAALSVVYPVARGVGPLLSIVLAVLLFRERPGLLGLIGGVLIVGGVLVISSGGRGSATRGAVKAGVFYGVATGTTIAAYTLWDAYSVTDLAVPPLIYFGLASFMQSLLLTPRVLSDRGRLQLLWQEYRREVLVVGLLSPVAYLLVLYAMRLAPVSLVAPAREVSIVLSGLAAWLVLGEANAVRRLAGSTVVLAGIIAIALA